MAQRRKFSAEYKREAVAMLDAPGVSVGQCYQIAVKDELQEGEFVTKKRPCPRLI